MTAVALRRAVLILAFAVAFAARASAQAGGPIPPVHALNDALLRIMHVGSATPFAERVRLLAPAVTGAFDLRQILQTSVGPRWSGFTPQRQAELLDVFTAYTVASYVANFDAFAGERFEILPDLREVGADRVVQTRIVPPAGETARIDYVMRSAAAGWRAVDVLLDGSISRVAVQRSDFRSLLAGGDPGRLIASLRAKTAGLESGARP